MISKNARTFLNSLVKQKVRRGGALLRVQLALELPPGDHGDVLVVALQPEVIGPRQARGGRGRSGTPMVDPVAAPRGARGLEAVLRPLPDMMMAIARPADTTAVLRIAVKLTENPVHPATIGTPADLVLVRAAPGPHPVDKVAAGADAVRQGREGGGGAVADVAVPRARVRRPAEVFHDTLLVATVAPATPAAAIAAPGVKPVLVSFHAVESVAPLALGIVLAEVARRPDVGNIVTRGQGGTQMHDDGEQPVVVLRGRQGLAAVVRVRRHALGAEAVHGERRRDEVVDLGHEGRLARGRREPLQLQHHHLRQQLVLHRPLSLVQPRALGTQVLVVFPQRLRRHDLLEEEVDNGRGCTSAAPGSTPVTVATAAVLLDAPVAHRLGEVVVERQRDVDVGELLGPICARLALETLRPKHCFPNEIFSDKVGQVLRHVGHLGLGGGRRRPRGQPRS